MAKGDLRIHSRLVLPEDELRVSYARSGGPGGQNVNKVETKVVLRFSVADSRALSDAHRARIESRLGSRLTSKGELIVHASSHRERGRNLEEARERMAELIREALRRAPVRRATKPTRGSVRRRLDAKRKKGERKRERGRDHGD